jgi:hypothetical protein
MSYFTMRDDPNTLRRIDHVWVFISQDEGGEGVCAANINRILTPLIAATKRGLNAFAHMPSE